MSGFTAVFDACVLYPAPLRSFLMYLAMTDLFRAKWSNDIHEEWMRNVEHDYSDITREQLERVRDLMDAHVRDCLVTNYQDLVPALSLPDSDDRHVLAAAIRCGAAVIVTSNLNDFPEVELSKYGIEAQHPDEFILHLLDLSPSAVCTAARQQRASLKNPSLDVNEFLNSLERQGLAATVAELDNYRDLL